MIAKKRDIRERSRQKEIKKAFSFSNREEILDYTPRVAKQTKEIQSVQASNQQTEYFSFRIQEVIDQTDASVAWQYNVPILSPNQRQVLLVIQSFQVVLVDYASNQFPHSISIGLRNYSGFKNQDGTSSNKIICLQLIGVQTTQMTGYIQRDLIYKSQIQVCWNLGMLKNLIFQVYVDDSPTPLSLPLANPLGVTFKILHVVY